jgi:N-acetylmuramoyl-L-alanine amidase
MASAIYRAFKEYKAEVEGKIIIPDEPKPVLVADKEPQKTSGHQDGIVFKVQFATSSTPLQLVPQNFKGMQNVAFYESAGLYRYTFGEEKSIESAKKVLEEVKGKGYKDAFIVSFKKRGRVDCN